MSAPSLGEQLRRASDRLVTPATVIAVVVCSTVLLLAIAGAAVWAELHGGRGLVVIDTVVKTVAALGSLAATGLLWVSRTQLSRIEVAAAAAAAPAAGGTPAPQAADPAAQPTAAPTTVPVTTDSPEPVLEPLEPVVAPLEPAAPVRADDTQSIPIVRPRA